ncbi:MAG TPA: hypothetical protein VKT82_22255 [Ktedonobacterales bacterium]|nr:hypothetical protein [Ktedonobacterales bacterium]
MQHIFAESANWQQKLAESTSPALAPGKLEPPTNLIERLSLASRQRTPPERLAITRIEDGPFFFRSCVPMIKFDWE